MKSFDRIRTVTARIEKNALKFGNKAAQPVVKNNDKDTLSGVKKLLPKAIFDELVASRLEWYNRLSLSSIFYKNQNDLYQQSIETKEMINKN